MSGPKVVRIVTREEMIARSEAHLRQLEAVTAHWEQQSKKIGELTDSDLIATRSRGAQIRALLADDRFSDIQREVIAEVAFLKRDLVEREQHAIERAAEKRRYSRRIQENAASLLVAISQRSITASDDLLDRINELARGNVHDEAEEILAGGFALLAPTLEDPSVSAEQRALARQLNEDAAAPTTVGEWSRQNANTTTRDERESRIDGYISELEVFGGIELSHHYMERLRAASTEERVQHRNLLLDSIVLDLAQATRSSQRQREALGELNEVSVELSSISGETAANLLAKVKLLQPDSDIALIESLLTSCRAAVADHEQHESSLARRRAVLEGLASLGYEVREGMATAWAESGKMVVRKSSTPGYGVELAGRADNGRLQVRAVALTQDHDKRRDKDIETIWCGEFKKLQGHLSATGCNFTVEQARGVGEVPVKIVAIEETSQQGTSEISASGNM